LSEDRPRGGSSPRDSGCVSQSSIAIAVGASFAAFGQFFELDDGVDLGAHGDVGDAFEDELDDDGHAMFLRISCLRLV
jgi:hypothetical protein